MFADYFSHPGLQNSFAHVYYTQGQHDLQYHVVCNFIKHVYYLIKDTKKWNINANCALPTATVCSTESITDHTPSVCFTIFAILDLKNECYEPFSKNTTFFKKI